MAVKRIGVMSRLVMMRMEYAGATLGPYEYYFRAYEVEGGKGWLPWYLSLEELVVSELGHDKAY